MSEMPAHYQELGEARGSFSPTASEGTNLTDPLYSDFWPPELGGNKLLLLNPPNLWDFAGAALGNEYTASVRV